MFKVLLAQGGGVDNSRGLGLTPRPLSSLRFLPIGLDERFSLHEGSHGLG